MNEMFSMQIEVRFRDLDAMGHVNNSVFFTYFEEGRKALFLGISQTSDPSAFGSIFPFILAHVSCDYLKPIAMGASVCLQMWVGTIGTKSFTLVYKLGDLSDETVVYARGESVQVCYDYASGKSMEVPEDFRQKLCAYQSESSPRA